MKKLFQSYLIIGNESAIRKEIINLSQRLGINLKRPLPDVFIISPEKKHVTIDQIRELKGHIFQKPFLKYKLVIIEYAEKATQEAQNALLKILEEPPKNVFIVLWAQDKSQLLPTIRSRVVIKYADTAKSKTKTDFGMLITRKGNLPLLLEKISQIESPENFLENQILVLYDLFKEKLQEKNDYSNLEKITGLLEKYAQTKTMIEANVNPKFALINLVLGTEPASD